jgi:hypothetical protein
MQICRAITWETAHADIAQQRSKGIQGRLFELSGCIMPDADGKLKYHFLSFNELSSEQTEYQKDRIPLAGYGAEPHYKSIGDTLL